MFGRRDNYSADLNLDFTHTQMFTRLAALIIGNIAAFVITLS
jgi:hypothetical protein